MGLRDENNKFQGILTLDEKKKKILRFGESTAIWDPRPGAAGRRVSFLHRGATNTVVSSFQRRLGGKSEDVKLLTVGKSYTNNLTNSMEW